MVDGNFSAEHMKMPKPKDDISLVKGEGYMVEEDEYQKHLKSTQESKEV